MGNFGVAKVTRRGTVGCLEFWMATG